MFAAGTILLPLRLSLCAAATSDIAPQLADSPGAQRDRLLALIRNTPGAESGTGLINVKMRLEKSRDELRSLIAVTEARLSGMSDNDPQAKTLRATRDAARKNEAEIEKLLEKIVVQLRGR
jgi:hypothetical protein